MKKHNIKKDNGITLHPKYGLNTTIPICVFCGEEKNQIAMLGNNYKGEAPKSMVVDIEPCEKCQEIMSKGLTIIEVKENDEHMVPQSWAVIHDEMIDKFLSCLNIPKEDKENIRIHKKMYVEIGFIAKVVGGNNEN